MTESARAALVGLRDFSTLQWYVVPLLALLFYIYVVEIRSARHAQSVEFAPNAGGLLVWDYRWWNRGLIEAVPIFVFGYLWFYLAAKYAIERPTLRAKMRVPVVLFAVAIGLNVVGLGVLGWTY